MVSMARLSGPPEASVWPKTEPSPPRRASATGCAAGAGRGVEGDRPGSGIGQFEGGAGVDGGRLCHVAQGQYDFSGDFQNGRWSIDYAIAVEILVEGSFNRFERRAGPGYLGQQVRYEVAVAVGAPHRVQAGGCILPRYVIAARRRLPADRRPGAELPRQIGRTAKLQRDSV